MPDLIADFYRQNEWANVVLIDACRPLTDEQLDTGAGGTYGTIRDTLLHIVGAETGYAFRPGDVDIDLIDRAGGWPGFDRLAEVVRATAAAAIRQASETSGDRVTVDPDRPSDVDPAVILIQMVNHSTEHRSQVNTILTGLGVEAPDLSGWAWGLAAGRVTCGICGSKEHYGVDH